MPQSAASWDPQLVAPLLALGASISFATAGLAYRNFSRLVSPYWMNTVKALVATFSFACVVLIAGEFHFMHSPPALLLLLISGFVGLNIGDYFLLSSYASIGAGRTLMIFSFNPIFLGLSGYLFFHQSLEARLLGAIGALCACVLILGHESFKKSGSWNMRGSSMALLASALDATGITLTRFAFEMNPQLSSAEGNLFRCIGAVAGFFLITRRYPIYLAANFRKLEARHKILVLCASFMGTFFALSLWLQAVKIGHLGTVAAVAGTGPLFATTLECIVERRAPSAQLLLAFVAFAVGFSLLLH